MYCSILSYKFSVLKSHLSKINENVNWYFANSSLYFNFKAIYEIERVVIEDHFQN